MPPKEKTPLTKEEISLISYWLDHGTPFTGTLASLPGSDSLIKTLAVNRVMIEEVRERIAMPEENIVRALRSAGVNVSFLSKDDGRISLQFINADRSQLTQCVAQLPSIHQQVVEIKMPGIKMSHEQWTFFQSMTALQRIHLEKSSFSDNELALLNSCSNLEYLNLVGTSVTARGLARLSLNKLKQLYLFQTGVKESELGEVRKLFPGAEVDLGGYTVSMLSTDTMEVKVKAEKKN